jgi:cytochrome c551
MYKNILYYFIFINQCISNIRNTAYCLLLIANCLLIIGCESDQQVKEKRYYASGSLLYETHCANCHQIDGKGLAGLYPPIANSDFLSNNKKAIILGMKHGMSDTLTVNGQKYTQPMPPNDQLYALDIAEITSYIYMKWGNEKTITEGKDVEKILKKHENSH